jgi:SAM-dependent methyltransferase
MSGGNFDLEALRYERARPRYPEVLFDRLMVESGVSAGMRALEIGPGTGQATEPLARRGLQICAIELGPNLAAETRCRLAPYPDVEVIAGNFEELPLPAATFDLVYAATALHWISEPLRFSKPHPLLKLGGHLGLIHTEPVSDGEGDRFARASQPIYKRFSDEPDAPDYVPPNLNEIVPTILNPTLFVPVCFAVFPVQIEYTSAHYVDLLRTFSPTIAMPLERRERFLSAIADLIDREFHRTIIRRVAFTLLVARRV